MKKPLKYLINIVTYFDILGFKKLIERQPATEISSILRLFKESAENDLAEERDFVRTYLNFSDLSIRAVVISSADLLLVQSSLLDYELESIAGIQCKLIEDEGIVMRGGIAIGALAADGDFVFGQGLVNAYEMETTAVFPRIRVSPEIAEIARRNAEERSDDFASKLIASDTHSFYVDYLRAALIARSEDEVFNLLLRHAEVIEGSLKEFSNQPGVREKYEWMRHYHNEFVGNYFTIHDELVLPDS